MRGARGARAGLGTRRASGSAGALGESGVRAADVVAIAGEATAI
jgi:hypothetical protein